MTHEVDDDDDECAHNGQWPKNSLGYRKLNLVSEDEESVVKDCFIFCLTAGGDRYMPSLSECKGELFQSNVFFFIVY